MKSDRNTNGPWELFRYSDADNSGDSDAWKIVTVRIVITNGSVIDWRFLSHNTV